MRRGLLTAAALCAAFACAAGLASACAGQGAAPKQGAAKPAAEPQGGAAKPEGGEVKSAAPKVTQIDEAALKSLLGAGAGRERPLLVNFWATWCVPCREEFPDLVEIREQYKADRLDFILVSLDDPSDIDKAVPEFLSEQRAAHLASYLLRASDESVAINLVDPTWGGELPATFLYDRSGSVVFQHKGRIKPAELRAALDRVLKD